MDDVRVKILNFLSEAPDAYWRAHSIKRRTVEASRFERVDAWAFIVDAILLSGMWKYGNGIEFLHYYIS